MVGGGAFLREMGTLGMRRPRVALPYCGTAWAALGFTFSGVALPNAPSVGNLSIHGPMGRHDDDDLPKPETFGIVSALSTRMLPPRPDILPTVSRGPGLQCTLHYTHLSSLRPMLH